MMKSLNILFFGLVVVLTWQLVREVDSEDMAWLASGAVLLSPALIEYSHQILSEMPYAALSLFSLIVMIRATAMENDRKAVLWIALAVVASYYIRTIGVSLIAAAVAHQFLERRYRRGVMLIGACAVLVLPWMLQSWSYLDLLVHQTGTGLVVSVESILHRLSVNATRYGLTHLPGAILPSFAFGAKASIFVHGLAVFVNLLVVGFIARRVREKKQSALSVYLFFYLSVVLLWPEVWNNVRFIVPAIPLMFYVVFRSLWDLIRLVPSPPTVLRATWMSLSALVLVSNAWGAWDKFEETLARPSLRGAIISTRRSGSNTNSSQDAIVACRKPFLMHVISGRKTVGYAWKRPPAVLNTFENQGVDFVVVDAMFGSTQQFLTPAIEQYQEMFRVANVYDKPPTVVYMFLAASTQDDIDALDRTVASLREVIQGDSTNAAWRKLYEMGTRYHSCGRRDRALQIYEEVAPILQGQTRVYHDLGILHLEMDRFEESAEAFKRALEVSPQDVQVHLGLSEAFEQLGSFEQAAREARKAIALDAAAVAAHLVLARSEQRLGRMERAEVSFRKSVELNPQDDSVHYSLAYVLIQQTKFIDAIAVLLPLVERSGDIPKYRVGLVVALLGSGRLQDAESQLRILAAWYPTEIRRDDEIGRAVRGLAEAAAKKLGVYRWSRFFIGRLASNPLQSVTAVANAFTVSPR